MGIGVQKMVTRRYRHQRAQQTADTRKSWPGVQHHGLTRDQVVLLGQ